jgi:hypothetical protein
MGKRYTELSESLKQFILEQKIFFVGTATSDGKVNISPKEMNSLRILSDNHIIWLNVTGSGNETAAHIQENPRMTIMFLAFSGSPMILRLYGDATVIHKNDLQWKVLYPLFKPIPVVRQIFDLTFDLAQTSCGMSVPYMDYIGEREQLNDWALKKGEQGIEDYWLKNNQTSLDGKPTNTKLKNL